MGGVPLCQRHFAESAANGILPLDALGASTPRSAGGMKRYFLGLFKVIFRG